MKNNKNDNANERLFCDRVHDLVGQAFSHSTNRFTHFLDERQQALCQEMILHAPFLRDMREEGIQLNFQGGYEKAQRKMLGVFTKYDNEENQDFPIESVVFTFRAVEELTHRDFLGALMSLSIKRELIGDILIGNGETVAFLTDIAARTVMDDLEKVGRVGVGKRLGSLDVLPEAYTLEDIRGTVGSMRLDCVVALVTNLSREKAANLVKSGSVSVNFFTQNQISAILKEEDILSIRGWGRYVVSQIGGQSKNGRLHLSCGRYV